MKIYTSYFYQIRFFTPNMIPISTAKYDPKWFSKSGHLYLDSRGVINGIRFPELSPGDQLKGLCCGSNNCNLTPDKCLFLSEYRKQLSNISIESFILKINKLKHLIESRFNINYDNILPILIVHESNDNLCSERKPLQDWLNYHNIGCKEWTRAVKKTLPRIKVVNWKWRIGRVV